MTLRGHVLAQRIVDGASTYQILRCDRCAPHACTLCESVCRVRSKRVVRDVRCTNIPTTHPLVAYEIDAKTERAVRADAPDAPFTSKVLMHCLVAICEAHRRAACNKTQRARVLELAPCNDSRVGMRRLLDARKKAARWKQDNFIRCLVRALDACIAGGWIYLRDCDTPAAHLQFALQYGTRAMLWWFVTTRNQNPRIVRGSEHLRFALSVCDSGEPHALPLHETSDWPSWARRALTQFVDDAASIAHASPEPSLADVEADCAGLTLGQAVVVRTTRSCVAPDVRGSRKILEFGDPLSYADLTLAATEMLQSLTANEASPVIVVDARTPALRVTLYTREPTAPGGACTHIRCTNRWTCENTWRRALLVRSKFRFASVLRLHYKDGDADTHLARYVRECCDVRSENEFMEYAAMLTSGRVVVECADVPRATGITIQLGDTASPACSTSAVVAGCWLRNDFIGLDARVVSVHSLRELVTGVPPNIFHEEEHRVAMLEVLWSGRDCVPDCVVGLDLSDPSWRVSPYPSLRVTYQISQDVHWPQLNLEIATGYVCADAFDWMALALRVNSARITVYPEAGGSRTAREECDRKLLLARTELEYLRTEPVA
ncbi:hypothetical protein CYMTET_3082 [Cymbomonas tetramitiformis]|uniref:Uncharacterized protein n=1 Tax=Cymbomonas tetramitiformis TaxID=36881 RepID=A0AAE0H4D5_9CHLO|nr:hypothetical protein CYMTET_3082 [Cymbomonas tetramitiformis]